MIGKVDAKGRALLDVPICANMNGEYTPVTAWIDTAFDGHLVFSLELIEKLSLESLAETEAILADGSRVSLETYICYVDWFGRRIPLQVVANDGLPATGHGIVRASCIAYRLRDARTELRLIGRPCHGAASMVLEIAPQDALRDAGLRNGTASR